MKKSFKIYLEQELNEQVILHHLRFHFQVLRQLQYPYFLLELEARSEINQVLQPEQESETELKRELELRVVDGCQQQQIVVQLGILLECHLKRRHENNILFSKRNIFIYQDLCFQTKTDKSFRVDD